MKKHFIISLAMFALISVLLAPATFAAADPQQNDDLALFINGKRMVLENKPVIENGSTLVPFAPILKELGYNVTFDNKTKTVTAKKSNTKIVFTIGSKTGYVNGAKKELSISPKLINKTTYVPIRFISDASGESVSYNKNTMVVQVGKQIKVDSFFRMSWNMTSKDVKNTETGMLLYEDKNEPASQMHVITYEKNFSLYGGTEGTISYYFKNDRLVDAIVSIDNENNFDLAFQYYIGSLFELEDVYGEYNESDFIWNTDKYSIDAYWNVYKNDLDGMVYMAMLSDELSLRADFSSDNKIVLLSLYNSGSFRNPYFNTVIGYSLTE